MIVVDFDKTNVVWDTTNLLRSRQALTANTRKVFCKCSIGGGADSDKTCYYF